MHVTDERKSCEVCGAKVAELRRNRCWGCYTRWAENRPVGLGAACVACADPRREHLRLVELLGQWTPMCHNCATRAGRLNPMPESLEEFRARLTRDRRRTERRAGRPDTRIFRRDRRVAERRLRATDAPRGEEPILLVDDDLVLVESEPLVPGDETRIRPLL